jgi:hypothetical protein
MTGAQDQRGSGVTPGDTGDATPPASGAVGPHEERVSHYQAAAKLAMFGHPLPGEDLTSPYIEDAQMWLSVYSELLEFKETLIRDTDNALRTLPPPGREDVGQTDAVILAAEADRFRQRIVLWQRRCQELTPDR